MSHRRIKAIAYDDDDFDDDFDNVEDEETDEVLTDYDREQLASGTRKVRETLGAHQASDKEIQDALWNYYYDISKTISFLKSRYRLISIRGAPDTIKTDKHTPKKKQPGKHRHFSLFLFAPCLGGSGAVTAIKRSEERLPISCQKDWLTTIKVASNFFKDSPWLQIPEKRRTVVLLDTLLPRGRLLGGSSSANPKMSKLAALAAKRRQKENIESSVPGKPSVTRPNESSKPTLDTKSAQKPFAESIKNVTGGTQSLGISETLAERPADILQEPPEPQATLNVSEIRAQPSQFASTIFQPLELAGISDHLLKAVKTPETKAFDFTDPSPDDVIKKAQTPKGSNE